jgi:multidrug efflux system membrane fusion protein
MLRFLMLLIVVAGGGVGGWWWWHGAPPWRALTEASAQRSAERAAERRPDTAAVSVAEARRLSVPVLREGIGHVQANALVTVRAQIDGRLMEVAFREGQEVEAGSVLARIDPASWQAQLDQALARQAQGEATLANARIDLERYERLAATNAGPRQQADQQRALVAQLQAQARADAAAVDAARINLGYTTIRAPIAGRAGLRQVDAGNVIRAGDPAGLVTLAQVRPIAVLFTLPQRDLAAAKDALAAGPAPVEALDTDGRTVLATGALEVIDNQVDAATGTIKLKASFANQDMRLWPGQFVSVRLKVGVLADAVTVPTPALRRGPQGPFVYVVRDGKALVRAVAVTQQDQVVAVIASGLDLGERVVTAGFQRLSDGKAVTISADPGVGERERPGASDAPARTSSEPSARRGT